MIKYLLDTHIFIWWVLDNPKLSENNKTTTDKSTSVYIFS